MDSDDLVASLSENDFKIVTIARHPLDVLISILHFSGFEPQTGFWLGGTGGDEKSIHWQTPTGDRFFEYAVGSRAASLLSITPAWWSKPDSLRVRYEELVRDPIETIGVVTDALGFHEPLTASAIEDLSHEKLRATSANHHFWKGSPGLWRSLLPADLASEICTVHAATMTMLNYDCDPDVSLGEVEAQRNWSLISAKMSK
ncbi:MAG: sulfotransferase domain-containing protein [Sterolibacteriaceae bacterium]|nr:sulfotransferase domain-containing protein [Sterolibacteriaceae bacterium]MBK9085308.1 sulfotransferase domain-containing protein [Sterolibacteriaceae bacterium]